MANQLAETGLKILRRSYPVKSWEQAKVGPEKATHCKGLNKRKK